MPSITKPKIKESKSITSTTSSKGQSTKASISSSTSKSKYVANKNEGLASSSQPQYRQDNTYSSNIRIASKIRTPKRVKQAQYQKGSDGRSVSSISTLCEKDREISVKKAIDDLSSARSHDRRIGAITNACVEFDHWDEERHAIELRLGSAHVLCQVLSMTDDDDEIRMICAALEMIFRASHEVVQEAFLNVGTTLVPILLRLMERCESGNMRNADVSIMNISKVLLYFSRVQNVRMSLARQQGLLTSLVRVATSILNEESRVVRLRIMANLANADENKLILVEHSGLLDSLLKIANLDLSARARQYAAASLMDLTTASLNQIYMAKNDKLIAILVKLSLFDEEKDDTREYAITALQNMAFVKENRKKLIDFGGGMVIEALKKNTVSNPVFKSRRRAAGTLTNLACEETAENLGDHHGLLHSLAVVSKKDGNEEVRNRAALALTKIGSNIKHKMSCHTTLLDALVLSASGPNVSSVVLLLRSKAKNPENRVDMANHSGILETLARIATDEKCSPQDTLNAMKAIMHLTNDDKNKRKMCSRLIFEATVYCASLTGIEYEKARDSAIIAMERLGTVASNRKSMALCPGLLVAVAKATERESTYEQKGVEPEQEHLAKPLLMSLLLAM